MQRASLIWALPMAAAILLSGCGGDGGGAAAGSNDRQAAAQPIAVGEPNGSNIDTAPFIKLAQEESCADFHNRLYVIDETYVFHTRAGNCPDNGHASKLYGRSTDVQLCTDGDSIIGPVQACSDDKARALFQTLLKNLDAPNLGLDSSHKVKPVALPKVQFTELFHTRYSGMSSGKGPVIKGAVSQNLVIKDAATFNRIWEEHMGDSAPAPRIDFERGMVLAVFGGMLSNGCHDVRIVDVKRDNGKILVSRDDIAPGPDAMCTMAFVSPIDMVLIERTDEPVEFITSAPLRTVDARTDSGIHEERQVVVKDQGALDKLWAEHAPGAVPPKLDFANEMLLASFRGSANVCDGVRVAMAVESKDKLHVTVVHTVPGPAMSCIALVATPAHIVAVKRSDKPVEFTIRKRFLTVD